MIVTLTTNIKYKFLLIQPTVPRSLQSSATSNSVATTGDQFSSTQSIAIAIRAKAKHAITSPGSNAVATCNYTPKRAVSSKADFVTISRIPLLTLRATIPPFHSLRSNVQNHSITTLGTRLQQLKCTTPSNSTVA